MKIAHIYIQNFRGIKSLSWRIKGDFNCLIGAGDTCKSTILTALDYDLSPRNFLSIDDSDFYNLDVGQRVVIQVTLIDWDESLPEVKRFFSENKCAQYQCGLNDSGPLPEPEESKKNAVSISLTFDDSLEPVWSAEKGTRTREKEAVSEIRRIAKMHGLNVAIDKTARKRGRPRKSGTGSA